MQGQWDTLGADPSTGHPKSRWGTWLSPRTPCGTSQGPCPQPWKGRQQVKVRELGFVWNSVLGREGKAALREELQ